MTQLVLLAAAAPFVVMLLVIYLREPLRIGLPLFAATVPFGQLLALGSSAFASLSSILGLLLGIGLALERLRSGRVNVRLSATVPVWLMFLGVAGATVLWSVSPGKTETGFFILTSLVVLYVLISLRDVDRRSFRWTENGILAGGLLVTTYGLFQLVVQGGFPSDPPGATLDGRFGNGMLGPNNEAVTLIIPLMVSLARAIGATRGPQRVRYTASMAYLLTGVLLTGSRGGLLAVAVAVVALIISQPSGRKLLIGYGVATLTAAGLVFFTHPAGIADRTFASASSSSGRTDIWRVAFAACSRYCPAGAGWETFPDVYAATQARVAGANVLVGGGAYQAHDVWVLIAIELGLPGLLLFGAGVLLTLSEAVKLPGWMRGPPLASFAGTLFAAFFLSNVEYKFFWMALFYVALARNLADTERRQHSQSADSTLPAPEISPAV